MRTPRAACRDRVLLERRVHSKLDDHVGLGRVYAATLGPFALSLEGSPSAPRHERRTGRTSECSASPTAASPFPRAQLQLTGSAQLTAASMVFPIITHHGCSRQSRRNPRHIHACNLFVI